jgi:hypothetical protein
MIDNYYNVQNYSFSQTDPEEVRDSVTVCVKPSLQGAERVAAAAILKEKVIFLINKLNIDGVYFADKETFACSLPFTRDRKMFSETMDLAEANINLADLLPEARTPVQVNQGR